MDAAVEHHLRGGSDEAVLTSGGVYVIVNNANGLRYVGQAGDLRSRRSAHWNANRQYDPPHLRHDWRMFGPEAFAFVVLVLEPDARVRREIEGGLIDEWATWDPRRGYNLTFGNGDRSPLARLYLYESRLIKKRAFQYLPGVSIHTPVRREYLERWERSAFPRR